MVYAFNGIKDRAPLWGHLRRIAGTIVGPWAIAGDFNCVLAKNERVGGNPEERIYNRLDRVLINKDWCDHLKDLYAHFLPEGLYDHTPCIVSSNKQVQGKKCFKYFNMWGGSKEFIPIVRNTCV
ncbi:uncharacterized protein LOC141631830 [Silene latifolia]|uniref:uncharacterized protein LOC141631830 n=1 Tax=Silene latifolia TaxID=37657 RepID=UPI003D771A5F